MDVVAWLRGLGLEQYEQAFRENDVDAEVLPELTAEDLIGLGVTSIGHRRKLLAAIAALREKPPPAKEETAPFTTPTRQEPPFSLAPSSAERLHELDEEQVGAQRDDDRRRRSKTRPPSLGGLKPLC